MCVCVCLDSYTGNIIPSLLIPIFMHFFSRQYWHWFRWCWSIGQFRLPLHEYVKFRRTLRLKNDLHPENDEKQYPVTIKCAYLSKYIYTCIDISILISNKVFCTQTHPNRI